MEESQGDQEDSDNRLTKPPETINLHDLIAMGRLDPDSVKKIIVVEEYSFNSWRLLENVVAGTLGGVIATGFFLLLQHLGAA